MHTVNAICHSVSVHGRWFQFAGGWNTSLLHVVIEFFVDKKTQGKWQDHRKNTGNLVYIGAWQPF